MPVTIETVLILSSGMSMKNDSGNSGNALKKSFNAYNGQFSIGVTDWKPSITKSKKGIGSSILDSIPIIEIESFEALSIIIFITSSEQYTALP